MTRFTIFGASGSIGSRLVTTLKASGHDVLAPARGDPAVLTQVLGHVIYAIGVTADFRSRALDTVEAHVCALVPLLRSAQFDSFLYLSSTRVYGGQQLGAEDVALALNPHDPSDLYNLSKLMGESMCLTSGRSGVRVARLSNVVGADDPDSSNFLPSLLRDACAGHIALRTDLASAKDYIHIDDVLHLLPRIATHGQRSMYNVASGQQVTHRQWVEHLVATTGCTVDILANAPVTHFAPVDVTRIRGEFGFEPRPVLSTISN
nr:NAD(P)-dependent oxidoreductase [Rhodoferax sp.]